MGFAPNDGEIKVEQVKLNNADFNAVVYQQHSFSPDISKEYCITTSTYTTEYIKSWIIDDVTRKGSTKICDPFVYDARGIDWANRFYWKDGCLRVRSSVYPHDSSLVTLVRLVEDYLKKDAVDETKSIQTVLEVQAFPIYQYPMAFPGDPVFLEEKEGLPKWGCEYLVEITDMDMTGEINNRKEVLHFRDGVGSYISFSSIPTSCLIGDNIELSWSTNERFCRQKLFYKVNGGGWQFITHIFDDITKSYSFKTSTLGNHEFLVYGMLTDFISPNISNISNICNVKNPPPPPVILIGHYYPDTKKVTLDFSVNLTKENSKVYAVWFQIFRNGVMIKSPYYDYHYEEYLSTKGTEPDRYEYYVKCYYYPSNDFIGRSNTYTVTLDSGGGTGCPYFYIKKNDEYIAQNTIMYYGNSNMRDFFLFNYNNKNKKENMNKVDDIKGNNFIDAAISENEIETDYIDRISLKAIKYDSEYNLTINEDGEYLFWREREKIDSCINNEGDNIFSLLEYLDGNVYEAYPGDTIYIYRNIDNKQETRSSIVSGIAEKQVFVGNQNNASIIIEYWTGKEWSDIVKLKPREYIYSVWNYVPQSTEKIRLIIIEQVDIDVITYPVEEQIKYNEFELKLIDPILHKINVMDKLLNEDNNTVKIEKGDTLYFKFHSKSSNKEKKISYLLITDGYYRIEEQEDSNFIKTTINDKTGIEYNGKVLKINNSGSIGKKYEIYNIIGRKIKTSVLKTNIINTDNIPNGIYFLKLIGEQNSKIYKFEIIR